MSRPPMTSIVWTRNCSALEIFALNGVALKSESTRTMFARSSATPSGNALSKTSCAWPVFFNRLGQGGGDEGFH